MYNSFPSSLTGGDFTAIKAKRDADYQNNQSIWNAFWTRAGQNVRLEAGDPTIMNGQGNNIGLGSSNYYINRSRPIGLSISGYQRRNRKSTVIVPLENGDNLTASQQTKVIMNVYKKENVYEMISESFHQGAVVSGMNLMQPYLDFSRDPLNGDLKFRTLNYNQFMIDPYFVEPDLSDAGFIMVRSYMTKPAIAAIMPEEYYDQIMSLNGNEQGSSIDGRFQYEAMARGFAMTPKLAYDEYWYRDYRKAEILYDKLTGESMEVTGRDYLDVNEQLDKYSQLKLITKMVPTVRLAIIIQDKVFYDGPNPYQVDRYPFSAVLGYYSKSMPYMYNRIQSVMTALVSPQILFNRRIILNADFLESVVSSGWIFKQGAVLDPKHLLQTGAGRMIPLKNDATPLVDVVPIPAPQIPPSVFQQLEIYDKQLFDVIGFSQENMGKVVEDDASGYQSALRTAAGLTALQPLFDRLDLAQNILGDIVIEMIQKNWTPGKIRMYLEGEEPSPYFYEQSFGKYHSVTELGFNTETQIQLEFAQLLKLKEIGVNVPDSAFIKKATLQNKDELLEDMEKASQQKQQMEQMQMQAQMQQIQSQVDLARAQSMSYIGSYEERHSRVQENRALAIEKRHEANRADSAAMLDRVKALKELESMDLMHLEKVVAISNALKAAEQAQVEISRQAEKRDQKVDDAEMQASQQQAAPQPQPMGA